MNPLLKEVIANYPIQNPQIKLIRHNENETYRLIDLFESKQYLLRIHKPTTDFSLKIFGVKIHSIASLQSEMQILNAIHEHTEIPVQIPVPNNNDELVTVLSDGSPATLLSWLDGNTIEGTELTSDILFKIGEMIGLFHRFSKAWSESSNLDHYSYDRSLLSIVMAEIQNGVKPNSISIEQFQIIENVVNEIGNRMNELDSQSNSWGIVHSDLSKSNLIIHNRKISPIDFSLCGYSYYYMDLGSVFSHFNVQEQQNRILNGVIKASSMKILIQDT